MEQQRANVSTPLAPIVFGPGTRTVYLSCAKMAAPLKMTSTQQPGWNSRRGSIPPAVEAPFMPQSRTACINVRYGSLADISEQCHVWTAPGWQGKSSRSGWSVQPCVRPVSAVRMTAGHNALRGSGPGQKPAFDNALAHVGCPDRRIDRLCITCCSPSQPSHHAGCPARSRSRRKRDGFLVALALSHHGPSHSGNLVGEGDGGDLGRPPRQQCRKPGRCWVPWILA